MTSAVLHPPKLPNIDEAKLIEWDPGTFNTEIDRLHIFPQSEKNVAKGAKPAIQTGTIDGTKTALTEMLRRIDKSWDSYFDIANFESNIPMGLRLTSKQSLYQWSHDQYPPHLDVIPKDQDLNLLEIFNALRLADTLSVIRGLVPLSFHGSPNIGQNIAALELRNRQLLDLHYDVMQERNIGERKDWYTDAIFAQAAFTGPNPMTIKQAPDWVSKFKALAVARGNADIAKILGSTTSSFYVQDFSYFRAAVGAGPKDELKSPDGVRFGCSSVTIFRLEDNGRLHPLAICIDFKVDLEHSVVIFNKNPVSSPIGENESERTDWPWRYAKTCAMVSDWLVHNITIHLTHTHLVEEPVIVAANRSFDNQHPVYKLLQPHWLKTLPLNASARSTLVPGVVVPIVGLNAEQTISYINYEYNNFDWQGMYVPKDLANRGFPTDPALYEQGSKYHNYLYARNMSLMWQTIRKFVAATLKITYKNDAAVVADTTISQWCTEMSSSAGARIKNFPNIKKFDELVDAVTMSIHIASPQHNAVNYLQCYYGAFVINKPPCLCVPIATSLESVMGYTEALFMKALPTGEANSKLWLLASHLPYLLSYRVADNQTLYNYALSLYRLSSGDVKQIAKTFYDDLSVLIYAFAHNSLDKGFTLYEVMSPDRTAVSILI